MLTRKWWQWGSWIPGKEATATVRLLAVKVEFLLNESFSASSESPAPNPPPEQSQRDRPSHPVYLSYPILKVTKGNLKTPTQSSQEEKNTCQGGNYGFARRTREKDSIAIISKDWGKDWTWPVILYMLFILKQQGQMWQKQHTTLILCSSTLDSLLATINNSSLFCGKQLMKRVQSLRIFKY